MPAIPYVAGRIVSPDRVYPRSPINDDAYANKWTTRLDEKRQWHQLLSNDIAGTSCSPFKQAATSRDYEGHVQEAVTSGSSRKLQTSSGSRKLQPQQPQQRIKANMYTGVIRRFGR